MTDHFRFYVPWLHIEEEVFIWMLFDVGFEQCWAVGFATTVDWSILYLVDGSEGRDVYEEWVGRGEGMMMESEEIFGGDGVDGF